MAATKAKTPKKVRIWCQGQEKPIRQWATVLDEVDIFGVLCAIHLDNGCWAVTDPKTGRRVNRGGFDSKRNAIREARAHFRTAMKLHNKTATELWALARQKHTLYLKEGR